MDRDKELELLRQWKNEFIKALCKDECNSIAELRHNAYDKGRADAIEEFVKWLGEELATIHLFPDQRATLYAEIQIKADELKEQKK